MLVRSFSVKRATERQGKMGSKSQKNRFLTKFLLGVLFFLEYTLASKHRSGRLVTRVVDWIHRSISDAAIMAKHLETGRAYARLFNRYTEGETPDPELRNAFNTFVFWASENRLRGKESLAPKVFIDAYMVAMDPQMFADCEREAARLAELSAMTKTVEILTDTVTPEPDVTTYVPAKMMLPPVNRRLVEMRVQDSAPPSKPKYKETLQGLQPIVFNSDQLMAHLRRNSKENDEKSVS